MSGDSPICCTGSGPMDKATGKMSADEKRWQAEDDVRILARAKEVEAAHSKDPARKKACFEEAQRRMTEMAGIVGEASE